MNDAHDPFAGTDHAGTDHAGGELSVPEANQRRWSGKKTAVVAAVAVGLSSTVAVGAANALPLGSQAGGGDSGRGGGPGGTGRFRGFEGGQTGEHRQWSGQNGTTGGLSSTTTEVPQGQPRQSGPNFRGEVPNKANPNEMPPTL
ncbi:hypothetical protein [Calidifontibacter terrae]